MASNLGEPLLVPPQRIPIGRAGAQPNVDFASSQVSPSFHLPTPSTTGAFARVNVVGQEGGSAPKALLAEILKKVAIKKFSGRAEDFDEFAKKWEEYLGYFSQSQGQVMLPSALCLSYLQQFLDPASSALLDMRKIQNPDLDYYQFWDELKSRHRKDAQAQNRRNWQSVTLVKNGAQPTLLEWAEFESKYLAKRELVENWNPEEDRAMIYSALTDKLKEKLKDEIMKKREDKRLVRVTCRDERLLRGALEELSRALGAHLHIHQDDHQSIVVNCPSDETKARLLGWDNGRFQGEYLRIQPVMYEMTGTEMLAFIHNLLEFSHEFDFRDRLFTQSIHKDMKVNQAKGEQKSKGSSDHSAKGGKNQDHRVQDNKSPVRSDRNENTQGQFKGKGKGGRGRYQSPAQYSSENPPQILRRDGPPNGKGRGKDQPFCACCHACDRPSNHSRLSCVHYLHWVMSHHDRAPDVVPSTHQKGGKGEGATVPPLPPRSPAVMFRPWQIPPRTQVARIVEPHGEPTRLF